MGGEDFGRYGKDGTPICIYFLGTIAKEKYAESQKPDGPVLPSLHSNSYAPLPEPSIRNGVRTTSLAVMDLLAKK
jgi:hippurate hydrolase